MIIATHMLARVMAAEFSVYILKEIQASQEFKIDTSTVLGKLLSLADEREKNYFQRILAVSIIHM